MKVQPYRSLSVTKSGNHAGENEDAWRGVIPEVWDRPACLAVADGATEAAFSGEWARLLVNRFVDTEPMDIANLSEASLAHWLEPCREQWDWSAGLRNIPWHGRAKVRAGAMATFLGVQFRREPATQLLRWKAVAVGDCCLFIVREGCLAKSFPAADPSDFGNTPFLVCSNPKRAVRAEQIQRQEGTCQRGDLFILCTDAVACWALTQHRDRAQPWRELAEVCDGCPEKRKLWVAERRADGSMRNDDATLLAAYIA